MLDFNPLEIARNTLKNHTEAEVCTVIWNHTQYSKLNAQFTEQQFIAELNEYLNTIPKFQFLENYGK
jgi:hypothetical protein